VKVLNRVSAGRAVIGAALIVAVAAVLSLSAPAQAHAITRAKILKRAHTWVHKRVPYSQSGHYRGYRRDCSGFVSMAWGLKRSYTTRTISRRAKRIRVASLKPGDAVLTRGHVSIFGGWKSKKHRTYYALEETTWGSHAKKRVRKIPHGAKALRRKGLTPAPRRVATIRRPTVPPVSVTASGTPDPAGETTGSVSASGTVQAGPAAQAIGAALAPISFARPHASPLHPIIAGLAGSTVVGARFVV